MCLCRYRGSVYETTYRDALKLNKEPHVRLVHVSRRHRRRRHSFLCTLKLRQSCAFEVCALAFHLAVRAALAVRAVLLQLAMRAGVAVRAVLLQLAMRTPLHTHREPLAPSSRKPPALLSRHLEPVPRGVTASPSERVPRFTRISPRTSGQLVSNTCTCQTKGLYPSEAIHGLSSTKPTSSSRASPRPRLPASLRARSRGAPFSRRSAPERASPRPRRPPRPIRPRRTFAQRQTQVRRRRTKPRARFL